MQCFETNLTLRFLAHAGPYIGIEHIGALGSLEEILLYGNAAAGLGSILLRQTQDFRIRLIALRAGADHVHAHLGAGKHQRVCHVIAIAYINQLTAFEHLHLLLNSEDIGQSLTRMQQIGQAVDNGNACIFSQLNNGIVREGTDHNTVNKTGKYTCGIANRFATADLGSGITQINRMAAQLPEAYLKRGSGTCRSLGEQHSQSFALQILVRLTGLLLAF